MPTTPRRTSKQVKNSADDDATSQQVYANLRYCDQPVSTPRELPPGITDNRAHAIILWSNKWLNGTVLHYYFFDHDLDGSPLGWSAADDQKAIVRQAFTLWKDLGIGLSFQEVTSVTEAEVRIGFDQSDGSWSYVGRDILQPPVTEQTMNFGWDLTENSYGLTTAIHEIGHTLGMPHEHQNPYAGIVWNEEAVYGYLGGPPNNWPRETTFNNVLRKLSTTEVRGSSWDPNSIMEYAFPAGLIISPAPYQDGVNPPGDISQVDREYIVSWYPGMDDGADTIALLNPFTSAPTILAPGQQVDYRLEPPGTRTYNIATFGSSDTVLGLFETIDGDLRYVTADDDSGQGRNARIRHKLFQGRQYVVRVRCYYSQESATTAVMYW